MKPTVANAIPTRMRSSVKTSTLLANVVSLAILTSLSAQTPAPRTPEPSSPAQDEVVRVTTNLVQVDAVVTDKDGKQVDDLRPEDFEILEDGRPQRITNLSYISTVKAQSAAVSTAKATKSEAPVPPPLLNRDTVRRTIVFAVDDIGLSVESMQIVKRALRRFVDQQMQPGDLVAVVRTGGGSGALQRLSSDQRQLDASIDTLRWQCRNRVGTTPLRPSECDGHGASLEDTVRALIYIVRGLKTLPGRKTMVFFTGSFPIFKVTSSLARDQVVTARMNVDQIEAKLDQMTRDDLVRNYSGLMSLVLQLIDESNEASAVIYSVDARGLVATSPTAADDDRTAQVIGDPVKDILFGNSIDERQSQVWQTQTGLLYLAHQTSGFTVLNNNDLGQGVDRIISDLQGYYLIGYRPADATFARNDGKVPYHKLSLRVLRPGLRVRSRHGFYGAQTDGRMDTSALTREQRMVAALESPFAANDVHLRLTPLFLNLPKGSFVRTLIHVDARDLTFADQPDGWHQANIDVLVSTYGENGLVADYLARSETIRARGRTFANLMRRGLDYNLLVPIKKPGPYQVRTAVRDTATNRIGSAYQFLEAPDLKKERLALSGIALNAVWLDLAPLSASSTVYNAANDTEEAEPTPAVRRFKAGSGLNYRYVIYNAAPDRNRLPEMKILVHLFREGQLLASQEDSLLDSDSLPLDPSRLSASGSLRLNVDLTPGQYVLQIAVTDLRPKKGVTASQWIDFEVVK
jgi:VWFA-related protein